ncbi:hypothetical protein AALP_AA1G083800 [Arabis alpina]|uniref:Uncharacterized protein n=1 Tax=Arabis alpina TaxID=50452 RepID=A0A087HLX5_ARAAL|nr:hypothetical protein AALP_AA1G083800 [Arabis alpina]
MGQISSSGPSSSRRKPVRRDILPELESSRGSVVKLAGEQLSTKEWIQKSFGSGGLEASGEIGSPSRVEESSSPHPVAKRAKTQPAPWYKATEEEAAIENAVCYQTERWDEKEKKRRDSVVDTESETVEMMRGGHEGRRCVNPAKEARVSIPSEVDQSFDGADGLNGLAGEEAQQVDPADHQGPRKQESAGEFGLIVGNLDMDLFPHLSPTDIISPLKGMVHKVHKPNRVEQRLGRSLGVKKKIGHNPFQGKRINKYMSLALLDPPTGPPVLDAVSNPSPSKTGPTEGKSSMDQKEPVAQEDPPGAE